MRAVFDRALWWGKWCGCDFVSTLSLTRFHFLFVFNAAAVLSFICCRLPSLLSLSMKSPPSPFREDISRLTSETGKWSRGGMMWQLHSPSPNAHCIAYRLMCLHLWSRAPSFPSPSPFLWWPNDRPQNFSSPLLSLHIVCSFSLPPVCHCLALSLLHSFSTRPTNI